jgi:type VI protein secretion system component Hcp
LLHEAQPATAMTYRHKPPELHLPEAPLFARESAGGGATGKTTFNEFTITKRVDKASPPLMLASALGTNLGTITLHIAKQSVDYLMLSR